ncbi:MAG TPA: hypothetical protein VGP72_10865 [Planctomycetota bacterium]|jgi:hypothetical protein
MPTDRSSILTEALRVKSSEVRWHFIADYYDGPISGLAFFRERLYRFCCFPEDLPEQHIYVLHELSHEELKEELRIKEKFEALVGTHWSFDRDGNPLPPAVRPEESLKRFYDEEKFERSAEPSDRPLVAWFDVAKE